jgi:hypothetical protein
MTFKQTNKQKVEESVQEEKKYIFKQVPSKKGK